MKFSDDTDGVTVPNAKAIRKTDKALLVQVEGEEVWVPQSQITDDSEVWKDGQEGDLVVKRWWAEKHGWG